jgi:hypothetical protein
MPKTIITPDLVAAVFAARAEGLSFNKIAKKLGVGVATVHKVARNHPAPEAEAAAAPAEEAPVFGVRDDPRQVDLEDTLRASEEAEEPPLAVQVVKDSGQGLDGTGGAQEGAAEFGDNRLAELATQVQRHMRRRTWEVIECGRLLIEAKALCGHGRWMPWLARTGFPPGRAARYMRAARAAEAFAQIDDLPNLSVAELLRLTDDDRPDAPEDADDELVDDDQEDEGDDPGDDQVEDAGDGDAGEDLVADGQHDQHDDVEDAGESVGDEDLVEPVGDVEDQPAEAPPPPAPPPQSGPPRRQDRDDQPPASGLEARFLAVLLTQPASSRAACVSAAKGMDHRERAEIVTRLREIGHAVSRIA